MNIEVEQTSSKVLTAKDIFLSGKIINNPAKTNGILNETEMEINNGEKKNNNLTGDLAGLNFEFKFDSNNNSNNNVNVNANKNIFERKSNGINRNFDGKNIFGAMTTINTDQQSAEICQDDIEMELDNNLNGKLEKRDFNKNNNEISSIHKNVKEEQKENTNKANITQLIKEKELTFEEKFRKEYNLTCIFD